MRLAPRNGGGVEKVQRLQGAAAGASVWRMHAAQRAGARVGAALQTAKVVAAALPGTECAAAPLHPKCRLCRISRKIARSKIGRRAGTRPRQVWGCRGSGALHFACATHGHQVPAPWCQRHGHQVPALLWARAAPERDGKPFCCSVRCGARSRVVWASHRPSPALAQQRGNGHALQRQPCLRDANCPTACALPHAYAAASPGGLCGTP